MFYILNYKNNENYKYDFYLNVNIKNKLCIPDIYIFSTETAAWIYSAQL